MQTMDWKMPRRYCWLVAIVALTPRLGHGLLVVCQRFQTRQRSYGRQPDIVLQAVGLGSERRVNETSRSLDDPPQQDQEQRQPSNLLMDVVQQASKTLFPLQQKQLKKRRNQKVFASEDVVHSALDKLGDVFQSLLRQGATTQEHQDADETAVMDQIKQPSTSFTTHDTAMEQVVASLRESTEQGNLQDVSSFAEIFQLLNQHGASLQTTWTQFVGSIAKDTHLSPAALWYYMEREDERKNPSWKRRVHRYYPKAGGERLDELNNVLGLAQLTYLDTADEVVEGLDKAGYELVFIDLVSQPGQPAHFIAVQTALDVTLADDELAVVIGIRGTKTVADTVTDLLCDTVDYRGGKAHGFLVNSAMFLAEKHTPLLMNLLKKSGKKQIILSLTGHSLGAGVAAIAAIEFNAHGNIYAYAYCFGTPPSLSLDLAQETSSFITTVVSDSDIVPRLSATSMANLIVSIGAFDWKEYAVRDMNHALAELHRRQPLLFNDLLVAAILNAFTQLIHVEPAQQSVSGTAAATNNEDIPPRLPVELYPPGRCIHFFRDGKGLSASIVPNDFFQEIDVSRSMIPDHLFDTGYQWCMLELARERLGDLHFKFEKGDYVE